MSRFYSPQGVSTGKPGARNGPGMLAGVGGGADTLPARMAAPRSAPGSFYGMPYLESEKNRIGLMATVLGIYLFMHVMPFAEVAVIYLHLRIPIVALMCGLVSVMAAFTMRLPQFFHSRLAVPWTVLVFLYFLASVFGYHPRYSLSFITGYALRFHVMPLLICAIVVNTRQVRRIFFWIIGAHAMTLLFCWKFGELSDGRLVIPNLDFQNPNDLALSLTFGTAITVFLSYAPSLPARFFSLGLIAISIMQIVRTGSRSASLCLIGMALAFFIYSPARVRIGLLAATPLVVALLSVAVPYATWVRLSKILVNPEREYATTVDENLRSAIESQMARTALQKRAIELALRHPLLGVGPLMFADAADVLVKTETGRKSSWQSTHNVYLEIASEAGIPALIFYVSVMVLCITSNYRSIKLCRGRPEQKTVKAQSFCLSLATVALAIGNFFCNITFSPLLPMLVGLTVANGRALEKELEQGFPGASAPVVTPRAYAPVPGASKA